MYLLNEFNAGISRLKSWNHRNAKACNLCPPHVRADLIRHKQMKDDEIAARNLALQEEEERLDEYDEECERKVRRDGLSLLRRKLEVHWISM